MHLLLSVLYPSDTCLSNVEKTFLNYIFAVRQKKKKFMMFAVAVF